ncbi:hypothetical protein MCAMS1_00545 [biofilm metagenome]
MPLNAVKKLKCLVIVGLMLSLSGCSLFSSNKPVEKPTDIYLQLGVRYMDIGKLELAKQNLQKAVEKDPNNARAHNALAFLNEKINHFDEAKQNYETAIALAPEDISVQNNYGRYLCDRRQFEQGLGYLRQAIANMLNDRSWIALTNSARCHLGMGQRPQAMTLLKQALDLNGQYPAALLEMQKISYQTGDYRAAEDYLQRYLGEAKHTSETLWVGIQTEEALGNMSLANEYRNLLLEKFPNSNEAKQVSGIR